MKSRNVMAQIAAFGYGAVEPFSILDDPAGLAADLATAGAGRVQRARRANAGMTRKPAR